MNPRKRIFHAVLEQRNGKHESMRLLMAAQPSIAEKDELLTCSRIASIKVGE